MIRFDLLPLFQGQMRIAKIKSAYNSLIRVLRGFQCQFKVNSNCLNSALSPVVYGDIALSINT